MPSTCCWATMSWSVSSFVPAFSAPIFETDIAPMTMSARIIAPKAMPRRYASRKLLKRDIRFLPGKQVVQGAPAGRAGSFVASVIDRIRANLSAQQSYSGASTIRALRRPPDGAPERETAPPESPGGAAVQPGCRRALRERLADGLDDARRLERLDDEVLRAELDGLEDLRLLAEGRAHDALRRRVGGDDLAEGGEAVLLGHRDVEGHQVRLQRLVLRDGLDAVARLADHLVAALGEGVADHLAHERGVIDDENACH